MLQDSKAHCRPTTAQKQKSVEESVEEEEREICFQNPMCQCWIQEVQQCNRLILVTTVTRVTVGM